MHPARKIPPGPPGRPFTGLVFDLLADPLATLQLAAPYGPIVSLPMLGRTVFFLNHPDYIQHVLVHNAQNYRKAPTMNATRRLLGDGLLTSEGEFHTRQRRLASPAFHRQRVASYADAVVAIAERRVSVWRSGECRDIQAEMLALTMEAVARCLFSADVSPQVERLTEALTGFIDDFSPVDITRLGRWLEWLPTARQRRRRRNAGLLDQAVEHIIRAGESRPPGSQDLLSLLLDIQASGGPGLTRRQARDEVMTVFLAGQETTGPALSWTWYLLSQHPAVEARLHAELDCLLSGRSPRAADLPRLEYTRMVFSEAMRLYPTAWSIGRQALGRDEIGGYPIPKGATLVMSQWILHRDPAYWDAPEEFRPERFHPQAASGRPPFAFIPFGSGHRMCLGEQFAWMEGLLLIAVIARRFRLRLAPNARIEPVARMSIRLQHGLPMLLEAR